MPNRTIHIRFLAIGACVVWGVREFFALQRSRLTQSGSLRVVQRQVKNIEVS